MKPRTCMVLSFIASVVLSAVLSAGLQAKNTDPPDPVFTVTFSDEARSGDGSMGYSGLIEAEFELDDAWFWGIGIFQNASYSPLTPREFLEWRGGIHKLEPGESLPFVIKSYSGSCTGWNGDDKQTLHELDDDYQDQPAALLVRRQKGAILLVDCDMLCFDDGAGLMHNFPISRIFQFNLTDEDLKGCTQALLRKGSESDYSCEMRVGLDAELGGFKVRLKEPRPDDNFCYGDYEDDNLIIVATAEADPSAHNKRIKPWEIDKIPGSTLEIKVMENGREVDRDPVKGPKVKFRFKGLPADNSAFGKKTIRCEDADPVTVKIFFSKLSHDNPGKREANWFFYWKQGCVPGLEQFKYRTPADNFGSFTPPNKLQITDKAAMSEGGYSITLFHRPAGTPVPWKTITWRSMKGIDLCHAVVLHEICHKSLYERQARNNAPDDDGDGLSNFYELFSPYKLDMFDPDTHRLRRQIHACYAAYGDQELICRLEEKKYAPNANLDWAMPGKQSNPPQ